MKNELDKYFSRNGPCMFHPTRYARHRLIDAIRDRAEESVAAIAKDMGVSPAAVRAALNSKSSDNKMTAREIREGKSK
jgi:predicted transcriptional regulator